MIIVNDALNIIDNNKHWIWNEKIQKFILIHTFSQHLQHHRLIHLKSKNVLLLFGDKIYQFSVLNKKWKTLNITMPSKLCNFGLVSTSNDRYVIIFGGETNTFSPYSDNVYIYDVNTNIMTKNIIKCPPNHVIKREDLKQIIMNKGDGCPQHKNGKHIYLEQGVCSTSFILKCKRCNNAQIKYIESLY